MALITYIFSFIQLLFLNFFYTAIVLRMFGEGPHQKKFTWAHLRSLSATSGCLTQPCTSPDKVTLNGKIPCVMALLWTTFCFPKAFSRSHGISRFSPRFHLGSSRFPSRFHLDEIIQLSVEEVWVELIGPGKHFKYC